MEKWIVTGVSGSGRIELLEQIRDHSASLGKRVVVHDVGQIIRDECRRLRIPVADDLLLDMDAAQLRTLRSSAIKEVRLRIGGTPEADLHLIGLHATFRWKGRLIPGIGYQDVLGIGPTGFLNVVDDLNSIVKVNAANPKWDDVTRPSLEETQTWIMEEELVTQILSEVASASCYVVAKTHNIPNLADLFFSDKKRIYLSYPITGVRQDNPGLLQEIQGPILERLEVRFVVFNPLTIKDMSLTYAEAAAELPHLKEKLTANTKNIIKTRTIDRDFHFIDQSDAVVVFYLTERVSPGVLAEIYYAHRNLKPVYIAYAGKRSPFLEDAATIIENTVDGLMDRLGEFAREPV